jgi:lipopolysaccharide transport system ATP-binding protein
MSEIAIEAENLGKRYVLGENTSRDLLRQAFGTVLPWLTTQPERELWAVRNASFKVAQGEAVGIIGRNGSGKSTLLKLLSRVTRPTAGRATMRGRVGTLLEVGTGFHPELSGRDNIFLSGTSLGMSYGEVARKFDDIVEFSELGLFLDTPVKRYSSGMYVRLAFAVASFLDPEILIVDEVLAVGDAAFERRSLGRLNEAANKYGRTVLFVSHNLQAIRTFCRRVIVLEHGTLVFDGPAEDGISHYLRSIPKQVKVGSFNMKDRLNRTTGAVRFTDISCVNQDGTQNWQVESGHTVTLRFDYEVRDPVPDLMFLIQLRSAINGQPVTVIHETISSHPLPVGQMGQIELVLPNLPLRPSEISLYACLSQIDARIFYDVVDENVDLPFLMVTSPSADKYDRQGIVSLPYHLHVRSN